MIERCIRNENIFVMNGGKVVMGSKKQW